MKLTHPCKDTCSGYSQDCAQQVDALQVRVAELEAEKADVLCHLFDTPLSVFAGKTALEFAKEHGSEYVRAALRRMGYSNPLEPENVRLQKLVDMNQKVIDACRKNTHRSPEIAEAIRELDGEKK